MTRFACTVLSTKQEAQIAQSGDCFSSSHLSSYRTLSSMTHLARILLSPWFCKSRWRSRRFPVLPALSVRTEIRKAVEGEFPPSASLLSSVSISQGMKKKPTGLEAFRPKLWNQPTADRQISSLSAHVLRGTVNEPHAFTTRICNFAFREFQRMAE